MQRFMAVRVLHYLTGFYMDYLLTHGTVKKEVAKLPAILPIVLYNGDNQWTAPTNIAELIEAYPPLGQHRLDFEYLKIIENEFSLSQLLGIRNIISALFIAEAHYNVELLEEVLLTLYDKEADREAVYLFLNWFKQLALHGRVDEEEYGSLAQVIRDKEEVQSMLLTAIEREKEKVRAKSRAEGHREGHREGIDLRNRQIVHAMHERNYDIAVIADVTGLAIHVIKDILVQDNKVDPVHEVTAAEERDTDLDDSPIEDETNPPVTPND
ncbi:Rpn family recombination-promoting nuclease/putative transposase [Chloroflexi bacterium TSY]|nr:Rpn family recombination-promoting nuclease/putative transposase [Chloroflexi bacterium TSY]